MSAGPRKRAIAPRSVARHERGARIARAKSERDGDADERQSRSRCGRRGPAACRPGRRASPTSDEQPLPAAAAASRRQRRESGAARLSASGSSAPTMPPRLSRRSRALCGARFRPLVTGLCARVAAAGERHQPQALAHDPARRHQDGDDGKAAGESHPDAGAAEPEREGEDDAERQADPPIAERRRRASARACRAGRAACRSRPPARRRRAGRARRWRGRSTASSTTGRFCRRRCGRGRRRSGGAARRASGSR